MILQAKGWELKQQRDVVSHAKHDKDNTLRQYKAAEAELKEVEEQLPSLRMARDLWTKDKAAAVAAVAQLLSEIEVLKKDVDIRIAAFLEVRAVHVGLMCYDYGVGHVPCNMWLTPVGVGFREASGT